MEAQLREPVIVLRGQLHYGVPSQRQIVRAGIAIVIGGEVSVGIALGISHPECPAAKLIAGVGGLADFDASVMGVGEGVADDDFAWCIGVGDFADYCRETNKGHDITKEEALAILKRAEENGFVHQITNNFGSTDGAKVRPCLGVKWDF